MCLARSLSSRHRRRLHSWQATLRLRHARKKSETVRHQSSEHCWRNRISFERQVQQQSKVIFIFRQLKSMILQHFSLQHIVRNAQLGGQWGAEEIEGKFPCSTDTGFDINIVNEAYAFQVSYIYLLLSNCVCSYSVTRLFLLLFTENSWNGFRRICDSLTVTHIERCSIRVLTKCHFCLKVFINGEHYCAFAHRTDPNTIRGLKIEGDVELQGVHVK